MTYDYYQFSLVNVFYISFFCLSLLTTQVCVCGDNRLTAPSLWEPNKSVTYARNQALVQCRLQHTSCFTLQDYVDQLLEPIPLLKIKGQLFDFRKRKYEQEPSVVALEEFKSNQELDVLVVYDTKHGMPKNTAYRIWLAIAKSLTDDPTQATFNVTKPELAAIAEIGKGGTTWPLLHRALDQLRRTDIWYRSGPYLGHKKNIFSHFQLIKWSFVIHPDHPAREVIEITVDPVIFKLYQRKKLNPFNQTLMGSLTPANHSFATILNYKLGNRYRVARREKTPDWHYQLSYPKFLKWILGAKQYSAKSIIMKDQIIPKTRGLVELGLLAEIPQLVRPVKGGKPLSNGWNVVITPGPLFFTDYHRFYGVDPIPVVDAPVEINEANIDQTSEEAPSVPPRVTQQVEQVIARFNALRHPGKDRIITPGDIKAAEKYIQHYGGVEEALSYVDWGVRVAAQRWPDMKKLGGLETYMEECAQKGGIPKRQPDTSVPVDEYRLRERYDRYCRTAVPQKIADMSGAEITSFNASIDRTLEQMTVSGTQNMDVLKLYVQAKWLTANGLLEPEELWSRQEFQRIKALEKDYA